LPRVLSYFIIHEGAFPLSLSLLGACRLVRDAKEDRVFESSSGAIDFSLLVDYRDASRSAIPTIARSLSPSLSLRCSHNGLAVGRISEGIRAARLCGAREESARFVPRGPKSIYDLRHWNLEKRRSGLSIGVIARCTIGIASVGFTRVYLICSCGASSLIADELSEAIPASLSLSLSNSVKSDQDSSNSRYELAYEGFAARISADRWSFSAAIASRTAKLESGETASIRRTLIVERNLRGSDCRFLRVVTAVVSSAWRDASRRIKHRRENSRCEIRRWTVSRLTS